VLKERYRFITDVFKNIEAGLIVSGIVGIIFNRGTCEGLVLIAFGIITILAGFLYIVKKEEK